MSITVGLINVTSLSVSWSVAGWIAVLAAALVAVAALCQACSVLPLYAELCLLYDLGPLFLAKKSITC